MVRQMIPDHLLRISSSVKKDSVPEVCLDVSLIVFVMDPGACPPTTSNFRTQLGYSMPRVRAQQKNHEGTERRGCPKEAPEGHPLFFTRCATP